jgi:ABC-type Fe3+/spermidine/putrescine transport system ATPase subunit
MLMGPSGSGKTTLISIMAGILTQDSGECLVNNVDINHLIYPKQKRPIIEEAISALSFKLLI